MAILTGVTNIFETTYYSEAHHTDVNGLSAGEIDASKLGRFYIEFEGSGTTAGITGSTILRFGTMDFVDNETQIGTHDQLKDTNYVDFNQSGAHLEPYEVFDGDVTVAGGVTYATDNSSDSGTGGQWVPAYIVASGVCFDSYEGLGEEGYPIVGYHITFSNSVDSSVTPDLFFPTVDRDLSFLTLDSINTHMDDLNADGAGNTDDDNISGQTYIAYADMYSGDPSAPDADKIVSGISGNDNIDAAYTGDSDGDMVDNNDGNPNEETGNNDSILAGAGNDTVLAGSGDDTIYGGAGDDVIEGYGETSQVSQAGSGLSQEFYDSVQKMDAETSIMDLQTWSFNFGNYSGNPHNAIEGNAVMTNQIQTEVDMMVENGQISPDWGSIQINNEPVDLLANTNDTRFLFEYSHLASVTFADGTTLDETDIRDFSVQLYQDLGYSHVTEANTPHIGTMLHIDDNGDFIVTYLPHDGLGSDNNNAEYLNPQGTLVLAALEREYGEITIHTLDDSSQSSAIYLGREALYSNLGSSGSDADAVVPGNDFIDGGEGADVIFGNEGSDTIALTDSFGNDVIEGSEDDGDSDVDVLDISGLTSGAAVDLSANRASDVESGTVTVGGDTATFSEIENIAFTDNGDTVKGSGGDDDLDLGAGNDIVDGGDGDDTIDGGDGDDSIDGGAGSDSLTGGEGSDTIDGGEGADTSDGGAGDDDLVAGGGDSVTGGAGDDEFTIDSSVSDTGDITIVGGETDEEGSVDPTNNPDGEVGDILDLNGLDHVVVTYDQTDPTWDGTTSESGTVTYTNDAGDTVTVNFSEI